MIVYIYSVILILCIPYLSLYTLVVIFCLAIVILLLCCSPVALCDSLIYYLVILSISLFVIHLYLHLFYFLYLWLILWISSTLCNLYCVNLVRIYYALIVRNMCILVSVKTMEYTRGSMRLCFFFFWLLVCHFLYDVVKLFIMCICSVFFCVTISLMFLIRVLCEGMYCCRLYEYVSVY